MAYFTDDDARTWRVALVYDDVVRVRERLDEELLDPYGGGEPSLVARLSIEDALLADVLYVVLEPQLVALGVDDVRFGRSLRGVVSFARSAFFATWAEFFPKPRSKDESDDDASDDERDDEKIDRDELVWELAGIVGVHPGRYTLRQLAIMSQSRQRESWNRTSSMMAQAKSIAIRKLVKPSELNPFYRRRRSRRGSGGGLPFRLFVEALVEGQQRRERR